jgi:hypothetical protein
LNDKIEKKSIIKKDPKQTKKAIKRIKIKNYREIANFLLNGEIKKRNNFNKRTKTNEE